MYTKASYCMHCYHDDSYCCTVQSIPSCFCIHCCFCCLNVRALDQLYAGKAGQGDIHLAPVMFCNSRATPGTAQATWASTSITTVLDFTRVLHHCCRPQQQWSSALGKFRMVLWCLNLVKFVHRFWTPEHQCMQQELSLGMFAGVFVSKQAEGGCWIQSAASSNNKQEHRLARTRCGLRLRRTHARHTA